MDKIVNNLFWTTYKNRIPLYTIVELTYRCNLFCKHCYIPQHYRTKTELPTEKVYQLIEEISSLGGLYLTFTGGEPFLRKDIFELISFAKQKSFYVTVFTNGTLIDKKIVKKLKSVNVDRIEISIYGNKDVHNRFVRCNVFDKVVESVKLLKKEDINVCLKTVLTKENFKDYKFLKNLAKNLEVVLKTDFVISAKIDNDLSPIKLLLSDKELKSLVKKEDIDITSECQNFDNFICSAGMNLVSISPEGNVYPCVEFPYLLGNIFEDDFTTIWQKNALRFVKKFLDIENYKKCLSCEVKTYCRRCPALCFIESSDIYGCSYVVKKVAKIFKSLFLKNNVGGTF